ncbi:hypothetical protein ACIBL3_29130 [Kribbella sp. NPDC050124]|uniref:hypothetical protein n=1 Tax=Kribbella sp. NPDC050124 TaxID=3364114 RepID=UPI0037952CA0
MKDRAGTGLTFGYTGTLLTSVTDAAGRVVTLAYDSGSSLLTSLTLLGGRSVSFAYTAGRLTAVTDTGGGVSSDGYDTGGWLTTVTDARRARDHPGHLRPGHRQDHPAD